jgi:hypothetical protein
MRTVLVKKEAGDSELTDCWKQTGDMASSRYTYATV